jgi:hypothetical protein
MRYECQQGTITEGHFSDIRFYPALKHVSRAVASLLRSVLSDFDDFEQVLQTKQYALSPSNHRSMIVGCLRLTVNLLF